MVGEVMGVVEEKPPLPLPAIDSELRRASSKLVVLLLREEILLCKRKRSLVMEMEI